MKRTFFLIASYFASGCASPGQSFFGTTEVTAQTHFEKVDLHVLLDPLNRRSSILALAYKEYKINGAEIPNTTPTQNLPFFGGILETFNKPLSKADFHEVVATDAAFVAFYTYGFSNFYDLDPQGKMDAIDAAQLQHIYNQFFYSKRASKGENKNANEPNYDANLFFSRAVGPKSAKVLLNSVHLPLRRNSIQQRIISASNEQCQEYKQRLIKNATNWNFASDAMTIGLAGLGSIFTDATTARSLAGAAGISAGLGDSFRSRYFQDRTANIISEGIDVARDKILRDIHRKSFGDAVDEETDDLAKNSFFWEQFDIDNSIGRLEVELENAEKNLNGPTEKAKQAAQKQKTALKGRDNKAKEIKELDAESKKPENAADLKKINERLKTSQSQLKKLQEELENAIAANTKAKKSLASAKNKVTEAQNRLDLAKAPNRSKQVKLASIYQYSVEAAVADAINYHSKCSIGEGLNAAENSVAEAKSPSLAGATKVLEEIQKFQAQLLKFTPSTSNGNNTTGNKENNPN